MFGQRISRFIAQFWTHIFVVATGFAALTHSTWTLATAFGGTEPAHIGWAWLLWLIPGFLIAFAFDIGQIAISVELRSGERTKPKYIAFAVLAISTYFLQWWYLAHHIPSLILSEGLRPEWKAFASLMSDAIIWIAPGLLPLATTLYTWSYARPPRQRTAVQSPRATLPAKPSEPPAIPERMQIAKPTLRALPEPVNMTAVLLVKCAACGKELGMCETERQRQNRLNAHARFCPVHVEAK